MRAPPSPLVSDLGLMSLLVDIGPQAAKHVGSIPSPSTPYTIPSARMGLLTGSDSCDSTRVPVAGETWVK